MQQLGGFRSEDVEELAPELGSGLVLAGGAQAADLPVKAKAIEYVKICPLYGAGFYYIPGADTCLKFSCYFRADTVLGANGDYTPNLAGAGAANNRLNNYYYTTRSRHDFDVDTRTATKHGVLPDASNSHSPLSTPGMSSRRREPQSDLLALTCAMAAWQAGRSCFAADRQACAL
ncbi:porin [Bradyrhizobium sp. 143]|nr:porin [Bradyrhizobium sp. 143]MCK1731498.1 porin [Bradyrhizobium sp. 142]